MPRRGLDRRQVVAAAADVADADGLGAVTVARLAEELGVRAPSLYNHVESRDALIREIGLLGLSELAAALSAATVGRAREDALRAFANAYRDYARAHPGRYVAGAVPAGAPGDDEWAAAAAAVTDVIWGVLRGWGLEGEQAVHAARAIRSALHGFCDLERAGGFGMPTDVDASFDYLTTILPVWPE